MTRNFGFYLRNIFLNPVAAAEGISAEKNLWPLILVSSLLGILPYWLIVLLGYQALGWNAFPYKQYYPYYFDPYWWEMLVVPVWGLAIAVGFSLPCYYFGKWFGGKATFSQVVAMVMLGSVVSLPIFVLVDLTLYDPNQIIEFAKTGVAVHPYIPGENWLVWFIQQSYAYFAMGWQGIVTLIGLTVIHRNRWFANIPGIVAGNVVFVVFLLLIRDYVALII
ncbi:MAG: hypothetical protein ACOY0R_21305 [Chloroflexota bacterium]